MVSLQPIDKELIWRPNTDGQWTLYYNAQKDLPPRLKEEELKKKTEQQKEKAPNLPFYTSKEKKETKGALIYTTKGYGIIQNIKPESNSISVRVGGVVEDFSREEVSNELQVAITFISKGTRRDEVAIFPIQSTAKEIVEKIEENESRDTGASCQVFWKGKEMAKTSENLEKLGFAPMCRLLVTTMLGRFYTLSRFGRKSYGWGYGRNSTDGIAFTVNKDIKIAGFGVYLSDSDTISGVVKFNEGEDCFSGDLATAEITFSKDMEDEPGSQIYRFMFKKPIRVKADSKYTCVVQLTSGTTAYGNDGKNTVTGDQDVTFTFSHAQNSSNGTGVGSGQVPTIYYYA